MKLVLVYWREGGGGGGWLVILKIFFSIAPSSFAPSHPWDSAEWLGPLAAHCCGCHADEILGKNFLGACSYADLTETTVVDGPLKKERERTTEDS